MREGNARIRESPFQAFFTRHLGCLCYRLLVARGVSDNSLLPGIPAVTSTMCRCEMLVLSKSATQSAGFKDVRLIRELKVKVRRS
jgi:hypothetical protein